MEHSSVVKRAAEEVEIGSQFVVDVLGCFFSGVYQSPWGSLR
jgi:hypothetical protein